MWTLLVLLFRMSVLATCLILVDSDLDASAPFSGMFGLQSAQETPSRDLSGRTVVAHRGGFWNGPEGSINTFKASLADPKVDGLELDIHRLRDGTLVVFHDDFLGRLTVCHGPIEKRSYAELSGCALKGDGSAIPKLDDVLAIARGQKHLDLEFKNDEAVAPGVAMALSRLAAGDVTFQVADSRERYAQVRRLSKDARIRFKIENDADLDFILGQNDANVNLIEMHRDVITPERVARVHAAGKRVAMNSWRWQMFEERFAASCFRAWDAGVDYAVTNNPDSCKAQIRQSRWLSGLRNGVYDNFTSPVFIHGGEHVRAALKRLRRIKWRWVREFWRGTRQTA